MLSRDELSKKLSFIAPNAKFSFYPDDGREQNYEDESVEYIKIDGWCIAWSKDNGAFPLESNLKAVDLAQAEAAMKEKDKLILAKYYADNLPMVACYELEKKSNPSLLFADYIDQVSSAAIELKKSI